MARKRETRWGPAAPAGGEERNLSDSPDVNLSGGDHFVTRERVNDFIRLMRTLPDPDPILRKMGRGITALQELLNDSHLESVWSVRCAAASGAEWFMASGDEGGRGQAAADAFAEELKDMDVPRIIEEMMDAVAYGYSPLEILWAKNENRWGIRNIVGNPPNWFEFNQENRLVLKTRIGGSEELPVNRILLVQHRPSYANPYGVKIFSKCFWPVTFKKNGFRWWTVFVEKYGGAFMYGKYPPNADAKFKEELHSALEKMIANAVAIIPEGSEIVMASASEKKGSGEVHAAYIQMANAEISKAVLGQTLTTEIGDTGSYAAAETHNQVRKDLAKADRGRISAAFNRLAAVYTFYNFGNDMPPPQFKFVEDEDLQTDKAGRDVQLHHMGWRPRKRYISRVYGIPEEDFDLAEETSGDPLPGFQGGYSAGSSRGYHAPAPLPKRLQLFASKEEKAAAEDAALMGKFSGKMISRGQQEINDAVQTYFDALGTVDTFADAPAALQEAFEKRSGKIKDRAHFIDEIRFAAQGIGGRHG
jgi:phage gp29-like protein